MRHFSNRATQCTDAVESWAKRIFAEQPERGSAVVEFIGLAVVLLIPLIYLIITLGQIQAGSYAAVGAADQASKVFIQANDAQQGHARAEQAVNLTMQDFGFSQGSHQVQISCSAADCTAAGSTVSVKVTVTVPLPFIPPIVNTTLNAATLDSTAIQKVGRYK